MRHTDNKPSPLPPASRYTGRCSPWRRRHPSCRKWCLPSTPPAKTGGKRKDFGSGILSQEWHVWIWHSSLVHTLTMMPILLLSEVKGKICRMQKDRICPEGVLSCREFRSRLTRVSPTLSVHRTSSTCRQDEKISVFLLFPFFIIEKKKKSTSSRRISSLILLWRI